jgi:calcineurin-like phosphoesterase
MHILFIGDVVGKPGRRAVAALDVSGILAVSEAPRRRK